MSLILKDIPTTEEYNSKIAEFQSRLNKIQEDMVYNQWQYVDKKKQLEVITRSGARGCRGGGTSCLTYIDEQKRIFQEQIKPKLDSQKNQAMQELKEYQQAVISVRDLKNKQAIERQLSEQAKIIEDRISETFRVEAEKFMSVVSQANNVTSDQTLTQDVNIRDDVGYNANIVTQGKSNQQGLDGSFFPIMLLGVMLS